MTDLAAEFAALNAAIKRSHEAIADMRAERKLLDEKVKEVKAMLQVDTVTIVEEILGPLIDNMQRTLVNEITRHHHHHRPL